MTSPDNGSRKPDASDNATYQLALSTTYAWPLVKVSQRRMSEALQLKVLYPEIRRCTSVHFFESADLPLIRRVLPARIERLTQRPSVEFLFGAR